MSIQSYKDLVVWQKSFKVATQIYKITQKMPKEEIYGLTSLLSHKNVAL